MCLIYYGHMVIFIDMLKFKESDNSVHKTLDAYLDNTKVGRADFDYNKYTDELHLIMIYVDKDHRRKNIATEMLKYLQNKYGEIIWGGKTQDGESLYKSYYSDLKR